MATPKKNNIVKSPISSMGLTFESGNPAEYPIAYSDNIWDLVRAATSPNLADTLGVDGQYDQHTINEVLAEKISLLAAVVAALRLMSLAVVQTLPTENISTTTIYLTPKSPSDDNNVYDEYVYINGDWEKIGDTKLDLSGYAVQADIDYLQAAIERVDSSIPQNVSDLQDSNDYVKGSDLATVATSGSYDDLNDKPTIPENISDLNNDSNFVESSDLATVATSGSYNDLEDKPDLAAVATSGSYDDLNDKPDLSGYAEQADIDYLQAAIEDLGNRANHYVFICKNYAESTSATISAATHGCGYYPIVSCYSGGQQVAVDIALNEYGDITVGWKNAADVTPQNPMTISVMGAAEITADEEEQPAPPIPDSTDYPYLIFTKTGEGECSVKAANNFNETSVVIPEAVILNGEELSVTSLAMSAFFEKTSLTAITIPDSVTEYGMQALHSTSIVSLNISEHVTTIGELAFANCTSLTSINVDLDNANFKSEDGVLFNKAGTELIAFPAGKTGNYSIPSGVTTLARSSFEACGISSISIPASVVNIDKLYTFYNARNLTKAEFASIEALCKTKFGYYYDNPLNFAHHLYINGVEITGEVVVPRSVTSLSTTFAGCTAITSIVIPNTVTKISNSIVMGCSNVTIYCEASYKQSGWSYGWNRYSEDNNTTANVVWSSTYPNN